MTGCEWKGLQTLMSVFSFYPALFSLSVSLSLSLSLSLQAQCLINVSGDAVIFVRESDQEAIPPLITSGQTSTTGADGTT
jgi:hypothetical protein